MEEILLIEDNVADIFLIQSYLRDTSLMHRLHKAKTLQEGLDVIRHKHIDLVLLDLALDDTAGFNTLRMFQQEVPAIPVIVLTGTSSEVLGMQIIRAGAQDYLVKGNFDGKQLIRAIRHAILRFKAQVQLREQLSEAQHIEKRYQFLHELTKLGSWELDLLDNSMTWSSEMFHLLGYTAKSFEPKLSDYLRMVHREDQEKVKVFFQDATRHSQQGQIEHRMVLQNRIVHYFILKTQIVSADSNGKVLLVGSLQDITEFRTTDHSTAPAVTPPESVPTAINKLCQLTDQLLQVLNNLEIGLSQSHKERITHARTIASDILILLYDQSNQLVINIPNLPVRNEKINVQSWIKKMSAMLEATSLHMKAPPVLHWKNELPAFIITDECLLSLLLFSWIQNHNQLNIEKEALQISIAFEYLSPSNVQFCLVVDAPTYPQSLAKRRECLTRLKSYLKNPSLAKKEKTAQVSLVVLANLLNELQATLEISKNLDISVSIPMKIPVNENSKEAHLVNILIIEHQTIIQIALKRILYAGVPLLSLDIANNLNEGIQQLSQKKYDLVLVDTQLPDNEPTNIIASLKKIKEVPLIAIAAEFSAHQEDHLHKLGVNAFATKPPQRDALLQSVHYLLHNGIKKPQPG